jgi:hypothetical protein
MVALLLAFDRHTRTLQNFHRNIGPTTESAQVHRSPSTLSIQQKGCFAGPGDVNYRSEFFITQGATSERWNFLRAADEFAELDALH